MVPPRSPTTPWALTALLAVAACAPEDSPRDIPPITWSGDFLDYAPQDGAYEPCAGTLPYMDRYVSLVASTMGVPIEEPLVYVHGSEGEETFCPHEDTLGCAFDDSVYSLVVPQEHELVHGVRGRLGFSHLFFEEGTAEVFGDDAPFSLRVTSNGDLLEGIESANGQDGLPTSWYPRAGHFVAFLHDRHGPQVTEALLRRTDAFSSAAEAIAVLEEAAGEGFDEIRQEYEGLEECDQRHYRYPLYGCDEPTALRARCDGSEAITIEERIACDDPSTIGPRDGEIWKSIGIEVPEDGEYTFVSYTDESALGDSILVEECSMRCDSIVSEQPMGFVIPQVPVFLRAGRYSLRLTRPKDAAGSVQLLVVGADCS